MKICFFNCAKVWGGGEKWHLDHALAFRDEGYDVMIVSNKDSELLKRASASSLRTNSFSISNLSFLNPFKLLSLYFFFRKEKIDILVMNFSKDLKVAAPMAKLAGIPKIVYRRGSAIPIKNTALNRFLYGKCLTDILANSEATKQTILQNNKTLFPEEKIKVIYNGIDIHPEKLPEVNNQIPVVGALGRLVYQKGMDILLDVAAILKARGVACKFLIGGDGPLKEELIKQAQESNLTDYVEFSGFINDSHKFMNSIDVFVLTSRWEGFGYVLAEAMLAKKPLVAFNISSNPELVFDNVNGLLVPFEDKDAFANAIEQLISNAEIRNKFGTAGLNIVQEKFDLEKNKKKVIDYLMFND